MHPPSRMAKRVPAAIATGFPRSTVTVTVSPGTAISTPGSRCVRPVASVVRKKYCGAQGTWHRRCRSTHQSFSPHRVGFTLKVTTKLSLFVIHQLHDVKTIEHMLRIRKVLQHRRVIRTRHVGRHRFDLRLRAAKPFPEGCLGFFALFVAHENDGSGHPVNDNGEEFIHLADIDLIDRNDFQMSQSRLPELPVQVLPVNTTNHRVTDPNVMSQIFDRHHLPQIDHQPCQSFRIVTQWLDLRQDRVQNLLAATAFLSRCSDEQHGPVQADPRCMHKPVKCSPMNHIPVTALRTPVTRKRGLHPNMRYSAFSSTALMTVA